MTTDKRDEPTPAPGEPLPVNWVLVDEPDGVKAIALIHRLVASSGRAPRTYHAKGSISETFRRQLGGPR
jgi:hypothetical protein